MRSSRFVWFFAVLLLVSAASCDRNRSSSQGQGTPDDLDVNDPRKPVQRPTPTAKVVFRAGKPDAATVLVEIVQKPKDVQQGLMYRRSMPRNQGMLFLMKRREVHSFWMRNTLIPLDMIFIDQDMTVVGVVHNTVPMDETSRSVGKPSSFVLETNAGWAKANKVGANTRAKFVGVPQRASN